MKKRPTRKLHRNRIRDIVGWCSLLNRCKLDTETTNTVIAHIVSTLPRATLHAVLAGDTGDAMLQAMKLTQPFFAPQPHGGRT